MLARLMIADSTQSPLAGTAMVLPNLTKTTAHTHVRLMIVDVRQTQLAVGTMSKNNKKTSSPTFSIKRI
jgi:hypothetical protein